MKNGASFRIVDLNSNKKWDVEVIQGRRQHRTEYGESIDNHCDGAISESESQISEETHSNIRYVRNPSDISR